jgi:hypothetical protein
VAYLKSNFHRQGPRALECRHSGLGWQLTCEFSEALPVEVPLTILSSSQSGDVWPLGRRKGGNFSLLDDGEVKAISLNRFYHSIPKGRNFHDKCFAVTQLNTKNERIP